MIGERGHALAKLTLSLRVTGTRADGFHLLDAEMVTVDLADELEFSAGDGIELLPGLAAGPLDDTNLVRRALRAVGRTAHVRLRKRIPPGAGLGGGSADAAAVLRWARVTDTDLAASLGADVPFCLVGGRARVTGIGDVIEPLAFEARTFTLLVPPLEVSTPAVYRVWDELGGPTGDGANDLEPAALVVEPRLAEWRDRLGDATGATPCMAGSGATWFVEGSHRGPGLTCVRTANPEKPKIVGATA
ncbi:MAG: 4-(cytidine 5'-diphospho)-2-C-methyl-D-erythritol kinase [Actinomycetota bacterium]|nr:4-(cytidine 5'-diphospho)-2-C-methyl-D-erythritol kinase [Actinomycetota bacterium]